MDRQQKKSSLLLGSKIEDFELKRLIGKGGFGNVYEAISKFSKQHVAIKMIDKRLIEGTRSASRVANEIALHSQLKHPSIVELYHFFEDARHVYLVMELCKRGEVFRYLRKHGPLPEPVASQFLRQVVEGLQFLHSHNIVHRDLKLANILLSSDLHVKIADFGLSVKMNSPEEEHVTLCGTPNYIAPEIVERRPHGPKADVWALGCMLFTFLVGKSPFEGAGPQETMDKVIRGDYTLPDGLSPHAAHLIQSLLQQDPDSRPELSSVLEHPFFSSCEGVSQISEPSTSVPTTPLSQSSDGLPLLSNAQPPLSSLPADPPELLLQSLPRTRRPFSAFFASTPPANQVLENAEEALPNDETPLSAPPVAPCGDDTTPHPTAQEHALSDSHSTLSPTSHNASAASSAPHPLIPNTEGLAPCSCRTRAGRATVDRHGTVRVDFDRDGSAIVYDPSQQHVTLFVRKADPPELRSHGFPVSSAEQISLLPSKVVRRLEYAARFVAALQTKMPKVVYYGQHGKCMMFCSSASDPFSSPRMDLHLYTGALFSFSPQNRTLSFNPHGGSYALSSSVTARACRLSHANFSDFSESELSDTTALLSVDSLTLFHAIACFRICLDLWSKLHTSKPRPGQRLSVEGESRVIVARTGPPLVVFDEKAPKGRRERRGAETAPNVREHALEVSTSTTVSETVLSASFGSHKDDLHDPIVHEQFLASPEQPSNSHTPLGVDSHFASGSFSATEAHNRGWPGASASQGSTAAAMNNTLRDSNDLPRVVTSSTSTSAPSIPDVQPPVAASGDKDILALAKAQLERFSHLRRAHSEGPAHRSPRKLEPTRLFSDSQEDPTSSKKTRDAVPPDRGRAAGDKLRALLGKIESAQFERARIWQAMESAKQVLDQHRRLNR